MSNRILVVAPHPDDESLGCGGTICLHLGLGDSVQVVFLTSGERGSRGQSTESVQLLRESEAQRAAEVLGVGAIHFLRQPDLGLGDCLDESARALESVLRTYHPDIIYLPHRQEAHPDHAAALPIVRRSLASIDEKTPDLRCYEIWTPLAEYEWSEDITPVISKKMMAIRCYRSQLRVMRFDRAIKGLNQYRGALAAASQFAEVFRSISDHD